jgi:hypothetical protein
LARSSKRREQHRTAIVGSGTDRRAELIVPIESIDWPNRPNLLLKHLRRWFAPVSRYRPGDLTAAGSAVSIVLDDFSFVLYMGHADDACEVTGTHDGADFAAVARGGTVDVYLTSNVDVRRSKPGDLDAAALDQRLAGACVPAFVVHTL